VTKLNQILAIEQSVRRKTNREFTDIYRDLQKPALLSGISRTYTPRDEEGEQLPPESQQVQFTVRSGLERISTLLARMFDVVTTKEAANQGANADIVVDGQTLATDVPVGGLLFLEKQLTELRTLVDALPTLDPTKQWEFDANMGVYRSLPIETVRSKKVPRNHVKAEPTDKHPAQVEVFYEDVTVGVWKRVDFSGALPQAAVVAMRDRVDRLSEAVKRAREEANSIDTPEVNVGAAILAYVFGDAAR
jgi:hypothetical protein